MGVLDRIFRKKTISVTEAGKAIVKIGGNIPFGLSPEDRTQERANLFKIFKQAYETVPLVTAIIDVQADQTSQEFFFEGPNKTRLTKWADKVNLQQFFHRIIKSMLLYGNAYVEIIKKGTEITEMKILDPVWVDVYRTPTGDITGYSQIIMSKNVVLWGSTGHKTKDQAFAQRIRKIDNIVHFKHNVLGSEKYGLSVIKPLIDNINIKISMESDLRKVLFKYVAPLIWAKVGSDSFPANQTVVDDISATLRDLQAESEVTTSHLVDLNVLEFNAKGMDIQTPLKHIEQQIISGGHVPPVLIGRAEKSDKSTAEVQLRSFGRHIKTLQRELKNEFEDKIIVGQKIGQPKDKLIWLSAEQRETEMEMDILRGLVTDGILTPQKANDLLPPRFREQLPSIPEVLNDQTVEPETGQQEPRKSQGSHNKLADNPNDPNFTKTLKRAHGKRVLKTDRTIPQKEKLEVTA